MWIVRTMTLESARLLLMTFLLFLPSSYSSKDSASIIKSNVNEDVSPCDDFYEYACGNHNLIRKTNLEDASDLRKRIRHSIEENITSDDPEFLHKLQIYYKTCVNEEQIENNSEIELQEIMNDLGGWPVLEESWDDSNFDWIEIMFQFLDKGFQRSVLFIEPLYTWNSENNTGYVLENKTIPRASSRFIIHNLEALLLYEPDFGIPMSTLAKGLQNKIVKAYLDFMVNLAEAFGANRSQAESDYQDVFQFRIEIAKIADAIPMDEWYNETTIEQLQQECPQVPWLEFSSKLLKSVVRFNPMDTVKIRLPNFFGKYCAILETTSKRILANSIFGRSVYSVIDSLSKRVRKLEDKFLIDADKHKIGNETETPRWKECLTFVERDMHLAVAALFARKLFSRGTKLRVAELAEDVRRSTRNSVEQALWLDENTRSAALQKLDGMGSLIAYPEELLDDEKVDRYYKHDTLCNDSFLKNRLRFGQMSSEKVILELAKSHNESDWTGIFGHSYIHNAAYNNRINVFLIFAGYLYRYDIWDIEGLKYLIYGHWGGVIGHEIAHSYDTTGSNFDKNGEVKDWWSSEAKSQYLEKTRCFVDQYDSYGASRNVTVNGTSALNENIADVEGLRHAYEAYDNWAQNHEEESRLPGLTHLTPRQLFWIAFANAHDCGNAMGFISFRYSYGSLRVNGPIMNQQQFARDFNCPPDSPMNPFEKCKIW